MNELYIKSKFVPFEIIIFVTFVTFVLIRCFKNKFVLFVKFVVVNQFV